MATPRENYAQQFRAYAQPAAIPVVTPADLPASVRTYSVFDPNSNTWRRMTNDGRSPIPAQRQVVVPVQAPAQPAVDPVVQALALARQTQGRDWAMPLPQSPAQRPSRGSRKASQPQLDSNPSVPASRGASKASAVPQGVPAGNGSKYHGYQEIRKEYGDPEADVAFLYDEPTGKVIPVKQQPQVQVQPQAQQAVPATFDPALVRNMSPDYQGQTVTDDAMLRAAEVPLSATLNNAPKPPLGLSDTILRPLPNDFFQLNTGKGQPYVSTAMGTDDDAIISGTPNTDYDNDTIYDESKSNVWKANPNHEVTNRINRIIAGIVNTGAIAFPMGGAVGQAIINSNRIRALAGGLKGGYRALKGRTLKGLSDYNLYNPGRVGKKGFDYAEIQSGERLRKYQDYLRRTTQEAAPTATDFSNAETLFRTPGM